jgi:hypothetical protein
MIIDSYKITNIVLDKNRAVVIEDKFNTATLVLTKEKPKSTIGWSSKLNAPMNQRPFKINHPVFKSFTFKLINCQPKKRQVSLLESLLTSLN